MANTLENVVILVFLASGPIYITLTGFIIKINYWECSNIFPFIAVQITSYLDFDVTVFPVFNN